jgi:hypothetical protein
VESLELEALVSSTIVSVIKSINIDFMMLGLHCFSSCKVTLGGTMLQSRKMMIFECSYPF